MDSNLKIDELPTSATTNTIQRIAVGVHGVPELKHDEKMNYLGEFRERIIRRLTKKQVAEKSIFPEIKEALNHKKSSRMLISGTLSPQFTDKYIKLARKMKKSYTMIHDPELAGETGLVVVSNDAVDIEDIDV
ncbi:YueI family protein [Desulfosporosinus sp.]|uniref:YueI family protein n=1 Tax=Desulfosporosinus sp. TaxID=157907 RepID=UPI0025B8E1B4|nr:YueI family protein [Desulfosporosinus sp.]MBC2728463.1 YueI family protein [Desulfosporosinus sp.]